MTATLTRAQLELAIAAGIAEVLDAESLDLAEVRAARDAVHYVERARPAGIAKAYDPETGMVELIANVQIVDRMGDLILSNPKDAEKYGGKGWQLDYIDRVGIPLAWCHNAGLPVGRVVRTRIGRVPVAEKDSKSGQAWALIAACRLFDDPRCPLGQLSALLMEEGVTGVSVGFIPQVLVWIEDDKERSKLGLGRWGYVIAQQELLELSIAPTPANQASGALEQAQAAAEKAVHETIERLVGQGKVERSLADDWRRAYPLGPQDAERRVRAKLRATVPMAKAWRQVEAPAELVCLGACEGLERGEEREAIVAAPGETVELHAEPCACGKFDEVLEALQLPPGADPVRFARAIREAIASDWRRLEAQMAADIPFLAKSASAADDSAPPVAPKGWKGRISRAFDGVSDALDELSALLDADDAPEDAAGKVLNEAEAHPKIASALEQLACALAGRKGPESTGARASEARDPDGGTGGRPARALAPEPDADGRGEAPRPEKDADVLKLLLDSVEREDFLAGL